jgi:hypothetical protein
VRPGQPVRINREENEEDGKGRKISGGGEGRKKTTKQSYRVSCHIHTPICIVKKPMA